MPPWGAPVCGPEEASALSLAPSVGASGTCSPGAVGILAAFGVDAVVAVSDLGIPAGTVEGHRAGLKDTHVGDLAGPEQEAEGRERPWGLAGTPEAAAGRWVE